MRLFLDDQYPPGLIKVISAIHELQHPKEFEIIHRNWKNNFTYSDTVVFLVNYGKKAIDEEIIQHFEDGYKVFIYKKPYDTGFNSFEQALTFASNWSKILKKIGKEPRPFIYSIGKRITKIK